MRGGAYNARPGPDDPLILALILSCSSDRDPLVLAGSSTIRPVVELIAAAYEAEHPEAQIDVQGGGSGVGVASARSGLADIGMVSRALHPDEADLHATTIARDGIALIAHRDNPVAGLTTAEVVAIYSGQTQRWDHGPSITAVNKEEGRSTRELFAEHFGLAERFRTDLVVIGPNGQAIATVAADPGALAYVSIGSALGAIAAGSPIRPMPLDGVTPSVAAVRSGAWPLSRDLNLVTAERPTGPAADFVSFVVGAAGQAVVAAEDFVPVADAPR